MLEAVVVVITRGLSWRVDSELSPLARGLNLLSVFSRCDARELFILALSLFFFSEKKY